MPHVLSQMRDPRIKKGAYIALVQDMDMRSTGGPLIPAGTTGKVLIKHNLSGQHPGKLWTRLDPHYYYMLENDSAWIRFVGMAPTTQSNVQVAGDICIANGVDAEQMAKLIVDTANQRVAAANQGGLAAQLEFLYSRTPDKFHGWEIKDFEEKLKALKAQISQTPR